MRLRNALLACAVFAAVPGEARAADPIMPLSEVRSGMSCTGLSVVRGTTISSFDVEVLDVIDGQPGAFGPRILVRASGPAVDATGIGPGFSGSPIYCDGRNAGAISESVGDFGGDTVLATPIEEILGDRPDVPPSARRDPGLRRSAKPLSALTVSGIHPSLARILSRHTSRLLLTTPAGPLGSFPPQELRPGAAASVSLSSGDLGLSAIGTVAYRDGDAVWLFGHPLETAGERRLLLQDAYVYTVIGHPDGVNAGTYKFAAPGHDLGTITNDGTGAVVGRVGSDPSGFPLRVVARNLDTGRTTVLDSTLSDEGPVGHPGGYTSLSIVGSLAAAQAATTVLRSTPQSLSGVMCARFKLVQREKEIRFCNDYAMAPGMGSGGGFLGFMGDLDSAAGMLGSYQLGPLEIESAEVSLRLRRKLRQAYISRVRAPRRVRAGRLVPLTVRLRLVGGGSETIRFRMRLPRGARPGPLQIRLVGTRADDGFELFGELFELIFSGDDGPGDEDEDALEEFGAGDPGPRSIEEVAKQVEGLERYSGVSAVLLRDGRRVRRVPKVFRDRDLRISGRGNVRVRVVR